MISNRVGMETDVFYYGDNLRMLRHCSLSGDHDYFLDDSVDLIYLDPPFNSQWNYNVLLKEEDTPWSPAQVKAFEDTWYWNETAYQEFINDQAMPLKVVKLVEALVNTIGKNAVTAYLMMMAPRLVELHRVLKDAGSLYLHCDPTMSHYIKLMLDQIFGPKKFQNEFVWYYSGGGASKRRWARKHDVILFYAKGSGWTFNADAVRVSYKWTDGQLRADGSGRDLRTGKLADDVWEHHGIMPWAKERLGYPTQKPLALLERIIQASSNEGDIVLDPFCGCGTALVAAHKLNRHWIGIDITHLAVGVTKKRFQDHFPGIQFKVIGELED